MAIEIYQKIDATITHKFEGASSSSNGGVDGSLTKALDSLAKSMEKITKSTDKKSTTGTPTPSAQAKLDLVVKRQELANIRKETALSQERSRLTTERNTVAKKEIEITKQENKERTQKLRGNRAATNLALGMSIGAAYFAIRQAGGYGAAVGSSANAINTPFSGYNKFMGDYANRQVGMQGNMAATGLTTLTGLASSLGSMVGSLTKLGSAGGGIAGAVIGGIASSIGNYFIQKQVSFDTAKNTFASNQDLTTYRLRASGLSTQYGNVNTRMSNGLFSDVTGANKQYKTTQLQSYMMSKKEYKPFAQSIGEIAFNSQYDVFAKMSKEKQAKFIEQVNYSGLATGTSNLGGIAKNATVLAKMTGSNDPTKLLQKLTDLTARYNGDLVANTGKMVQLLQTTNLTPDQATALATKYANNPAWQSTIASQHSNITPQGTYIGKMLMKLAGASPQEMAQGYFSTKRMNKWRTDASRGSLNPMEQIMAMAMQYLSINPMAKDIATVGGKKGGNVIENTAQMNDFLDKAAKALGDITISNQTVHAGQVYVMQGNQGFWVQNPQAQSSSNKSGTGQVGRL